MTTPVRSVLDTRHDQMFPRLERHRLHGVMRRVSTVLSCEKMLGYANHLGLYGEELGPQAQHLGNFPQAFTHLALISAAFDLDRRLSAAGHAG